MAENVGKFSKRQAISQHLQDTSETKKVMKPLKIDKNKSSFMSFYSTDLKIGDSIRHKRQKKVDKINEQQLVSSATYIDSGRRKFKEKKGMKGSKGCFCRSKENEAEPLQLNVTK